MTRDEFKQQLCAITAPRIAHQYFDMAIRGMEVPDVDDMGRFDEDADTVCELWAEAVMRGKEGELFDVENATRWRPSTRGIGELLYGADGVDVAWIGPDGRWWVTCNGNTIFYNDRNANGKSDCGDATPACDTMSHTCVACIEKVDCKDVIGLPLCSATQRQATRSRPRSLFRGHFVAPHPARHCTIVLVFLLSTPGRP